MGLFSGDAVRNSVMAQDCLISSVLKFATSKQFLCGIGFGFVVSYACRRLFTKTDKTMELESEKCAHAAVKAFRMAYERCPELLLTWLENGEPKVVVRTESEDDLMELRKAARAEGLIAAIIQDAGRTQIAPGSRTVLGVGPGPCELVDRVTGHLKLC